MSLFTVFFTYLAGREAGAQRGGLLPAGSVAFLPQFSFRGSHISNDGLVMTMSALSLYFIVRVIRRGSAGLIVMLAGVGDHSSLLEQDQCEEKPWRQPLSQLTLVSSLMLGLVM